MPACHDLQTALPIAQDGFSVRARRFVENGCLHLGTGPDNQPAARCTP
jgi:hypothetical protein